MSLVPSPGLYITPGTWIVHESFNNDSETDPRLGIVEDIESKDSHLTDLVEILSIPDGLLQEKINRLSWEGVGCVERSTKTWKG